MKKQDEIIEPPYVEIEWHPSSEEVAANGEFTFGVYMTNYSADFALERAILKWVESIDEDEDINLTIRLRLRDVYKELYEMNCFNDGTVDEESSPLFDALRKDCEWIIKQIKGLKKGVVDGTT